MVTMARKRDPWLDREIARYIATGDSDSLGQIGPAETMFEGMENYSRALRRALAAEVRRCSRRRKHQPVPDGMGSAFARRRLAPMVTGLFSAKERDVVLGVVERSVVFLTRDVALRLIEEVDFESSAWQIANVYLCGIGAPTLGDGDFCALGLSEETRCYVSLAYFEEDNPYADYVVHEAAHIFHNTKRERIGLPHTRYREWMLQIDFCKRETFAYTCEVYSRILQLSSTPAQRRAHLEAYVERPIPGEERVDTAEHMDILTEAVGARNGWKRILKRCAPPRRREQGRLSRKPGSERRSGRSLGGSEGEGGC